MKKALKLILKTLIEILKELRTIRKILESWNKDGAHIIGIDSAMQKPETSPAYAVTMRDEKITSVYMVKPQPEPEPIIAQETTNLTIILDEEKCQGKVQLVCDEINKTPIPIYENIGFEAGCEPIGYTVSGNAFVDGNEKDMVVVFEIELKNDDGRTFTIKPQFDDDYELAGDGVAFIDKVKCFSINFFESMRVEREEMQDE